MGKEKKRNLPQRLLTSPFAFIVTSCILCVLSCLYAIPRFLLPSVIKGGEQREQRIA